MSEIVPFKGIIYNKEKFESLTDLISPPYDVIDSELQARLYQKNTYNFARLDLPQEPGSSRYDAAKITFENWCDENILVQDGKPSFYFHHHEYKHPDGTRKIRQGFFAAFRVEDYSAGSVKPHEKTLDAPKQDRLKMTKATKANLSPIFALYADPEKKIERMSSKLKRTVPLFDFVTEEGDHHQIWRESDPIICKIISETIAPVPVFIADGHHRYETSIAYRNESMAESQQVSDREAFNFTMMYLCNRADAGLTILPIHRALNHMGKFDYNYFIGQLEQYFSVKPLFSKSREEILQDLARAGQVGTSFAIISKNSHYSKLITLKRNAWYSSPMVHTVPKALVHLDVTILHRLVFEEILHMTQTSQAKEEHITYFKDADRAIESVKNGSSEIAILLNPTPISAMEETALSGEKMPQKSTYFYPKVPSGLVIHSLIGKD